MLRQIFTMFGVRVVFDAENGDALEVARAIYTQWDQPGLFDGTSVVHVVLKEYSVNENPSADTSHVEGSLLAITSNGISAQADGVAGKGQCICGREAIGSDAFAELVNTVVLFLVAHRGRIPIHASAVMLGDDAVILAGRSGSGKSSLALAADRASLPILSDDTVFVQTEPSFRVWALPQSVHVFEKDAPANSGGAMRLRSGRWKRALPISEPKQRAERAILCVLVKGDRVALEPMPEDEAAARLMENPEPGYEFYGARSVAAIRALAAGGCWRLTLSADPAEAIELVKRTFVLEQNASFHGRYLEIVNHIERNFPVAHWKSGDVDIWPFARMDLYLDMYWDSVGGAPPAPRAFPLRVASNVARPFVNLWRSRRDFAHLARRAKPAHAIFLGDGVSLDRNDGAWEDRFSEPLIAAMEKRGLGAFLMQSGDLSRLPWHRPTFPANLVEARGWLASLFATTPAELPGHEQAQQFLADNDVSAPSLSRRALTRRARAVSATASAFERILQIVKPKIAFVVTYYAGLGHALALACRRQGILSVDLQHCPQIAHKAYAWPGLPDNGYTTLPALFWNWTEADAARIRSWTDTLALPWHRSLHGGHTQIASLASDAERGMWETNINAVGKDAFEREILVALQPIGGHRPLWETLAAQIEAAPSSWRWWIRRHPSSRTHQDVEFGRLLSMRKSNVLSDEASELPLPVLLQHVNVVVSLVSGVAAEAAMFGIPSLFLSNEAHTLFSDLIARGMARVIEVGQTNTEIACLRVAKTPQKLPPQPNLNDVLRHVEMIAQNYAKLNTAQETSR